MLIKIKNKIIALIYWSQRYFKIDLFYLMRGEFWLMLGKIINMAAAFCLALAWANWIDKNIYGNYQYILSLVGIISIFSLPEIGASVTQAVARGLEGSFLTGFKTQLKWGLLASLAALGIAGYYWLQGNENFPLVFLVIAVFLPFFNAALLYGDFLMGRKLFNIQVRYDSATQIIAAGIMIAALFLIKKFLFNLPNCIIILLIIVVYFLSRTGLRLFFFARTKIKFSPNKKEDPKTISYGKHLTLAEVIGNFANNLDRILLFHYLGAVELAIYSFAILIPKQIDVFLKHIGALAFPKFSLRPINEIQRTLLKKIGYLTILITCSVLVYIVIAPYLYQFFFPEYVTSVPYSRLYALSMIPVCFSFINSVFRAKMMTKQIYQIKIIVPLFRGGLFLILIPLYGIWGAVIALLGARTFSALLMLFLYRKI